jgi:hypothetical protein
VKQLSEFLSPSRATKCVRFEINDPTNPDGYIEIGRLGLGNYWQPDFGVSFGYSAGRVINTRTVSARSGALYGRRRPQHREIVLQLDWLKTRAEDMKIQSMLASVDAVNNVYFSGFPGEPQGAFRKFHSGLFFIQDIGKPTLSLPGFAGISITLREAI